jgi:dTMP kinase
LTQNKNIDHEGQGVLVAFEGIDGTGKSTQIRLLAESLRDMGHTVQLTREPTDGPVGQRIRELYIIQPSLAAGRIVLTDRYYLSTAAYQGAAGLDPAEIIRRNELFAPVPDLVILLVVPPVLGIERIRTLRGEALNAFEQEAELERVAAIFDQLNQKYIKRIDATQSVAAVQQAVFAEVKQFLSGRGDAADMAAVEA